MPKRAKVRLEFAEKLFYEKTLIDWKANVPDKNHGYVIQKALDNLRRFPINVNGYAELRQIKGIGESIATRLDAAWRSACEAYFQVDAPSVEQVRTLSTGEFLQFVESAVVSKGRRDALPFVPRKQGVNSQAPDAAAVAGPSRCALSQLTTPKSTTLPPNGDDNFVNEVIVMSDDDDDEINDFLNMSRSQPTLSYSNASYEPTVNQAALSSSSAAGGRDFSFSQPLTNGKTSAATTFVAPLPPPAVRLTATQRLDDAAAASSVLSLPASAPLSSSSSSQTAEVLVYDPANYEHYELLLIVDGRENVGGRGRASNRQTIDEHLTKLDVRHEFRPLAVGDYLWVARRRDVAVAAAELVMDYVVERKTWDDLKRSIRETRYAEQKRRLRESGVRNVVLVTEGAPTADRSLEQALVSTSVSNGFLVHRTPNLQGTAKFLKCIHDRLTKRMKIEHFCGQSFVALQDNSRKTKTLTVRDCWLRQLTVCPQMSVEKAALLAERFPTMRTLVHFYRRKAADGAVPGDEEWKMLLYRELNDIPKALSAQLSLFFK